MKSGGSCNKFSRAVEISLRICLLITVITSLVLVWKSEVDPSSSPTPPFNTTPLPSSIRAGGLAAFLLIQSFLSSLSLLLLFAVSCKCTCGGGAGRVAKLTLAHTLLTVVEVVGSTVGVYLAWKASDGADVMYGVTVAAVTTLWVIGFVFLPFHLNNATVWDGNARSFLIVSAFIPAAYMRAANFYPFFVRLFLSIPTVIVAGLSIRADAVGNVTSPPQCDKAFAYLVGDVIIFLFHYICVVYFSLRAVTSMTPINLHRAFVLFSTVVVMEVGWVATGIVFLAFPSPSLSCPSYPPLSTTFIVMVVCDICVSVSFIITILVKLRPIQRSYASAKKAQLYSDKVIALRRERVRARAAAAANGREVASNEGASRSGEDENGGGGGGESANILPSAPSFDEFFLPSPLHASHSQSGGGEEGGTAYYRFSSMFTVALPSRPPSTRLPSAPTLEELVQDDSLWDDRV